MSDADGFRESALDAMIDAALSIMGTCPASLLIGIPVSKDFLSQQARRPQIRGIFLRTQTSGAYIDTASNETANFAPSAIIIQRTPLLGVRQLLVLARSGVRRIVQLEHRRVPKCRSIAGRLIAELAASVLSRLSRLLRRSPASILFERMQLRAMRRLRLDQIPIQTARFGTGPVIHATGGLGSGGSERQLTLTVSGLHSTMDRQVRVVCQHRLEGALAFFSEPLRRAGIPIEDDVLADFSPVVTNTQLIETLNRSFPRESEFADTICAFARMIARDNPSVVHCWLDPINVAAGIAAALCGVPRIVLGCRSVAPIHFDLYERNMWAGYRALLQLPHVTMLNNSNAGAASYSAWLGIARDRIQVIPNAVDASFDATADPTAQAGFRTRFDLGHGPVIGMLGRMSEEKRPLFWLDIARLVLQSRPDVKFLWAGDGPMRQAMIARAKQYAMSERLILPGTMNDAAIPLSTMTALLLSSRMEGLPNVLLEAQSLGVPVVTASVGGAPETIDEGVTGRAVAGSSPQDFADALLSFVNDPAALARAKSAGPQFIKKRFSVERAIEQTRSIYRLP